MFQRIACACLTALLATAAQAREAPDFRATAHAVAVASLLGDEINAGPDGVHPVPDAGFDDVAERAMAGQIAADLPAASVARVGAARGALLRQIYPANGFGDRGMAAVRESLKPWAAAHPVDYVVILRKTVGTIEYRDVGHSMSDHYSTFGVGLSGGAPFAFLNVTVCDGRTLAVVAELSARDLNWGSIAYKRTDPTPEHLPVLTADVRAMLAAVVPGLVHGAGL